MQHSRGPQADVRFWGTLLREEVPAPTGWRADPAETLPFPYRKTCSRVPASLVLGVGTWEMEQGLERFIRFYKAVLW